jgi:hypothetical protein
MKRDEFYNRIVGVEEMNKDDKCSGCKDADNKRLIIRLKNLMKTSAAVMGGYVSNKSSAGMKTATI